MLPGVIEASLADIQLLPQKLRCGSTLISDRNQFCSACFMHTEHQPSFGMENFLNAEINSYSRFTKTYGAILSAGTKQYMTKAMYEFTVTNKNQKDKHGQMSSHVSETAKTYPEQELLLPKTTGMIKDMRCLYHNLAY